MPIYHAWTVKFRPIGKHKANVAYAVTVEFNKVGDLVKGRPPRPWVFTPCIEGLERVEYARLDDAKDGIWFTLTELISRRGKNPLSHLKAPTKFHQIT